jgi:hypothetical protein
MFNEALLDKLSPEMEDFVNQKLDSIEDSEIMGLVKIFEMFPSGEDWYVSPQLGNEGLLMLDWQLLVFEEAKDRNLVFNRPKFWTKEQIETRPAFIQSLRKTVKPKQDIYYNPHEEDDNPHEEDDEEFPKETYEVTDEDLELLHEEG